MNILIISPIDPVAVERLAAHHDIVEAPQATATAIRSLITDREALIFRSGVAITADLMQRAPNLKVLIRAGSGFDNVDLEYAERHGITFVRIPEPGARAVAELTFALMLALARNVVRADAAWRNGHWLKHALPGYILRGKVLGIVGVGNIGTEVGELGVAWGMKVIGCHENPSASIVAALRAKSIRVASFDEVVSQAQFLTIHVPLKDSTRHLIDAEVLRRMRKGSFLLNLARGGVVDEAALRAELVSGERLFGAGLDVHEAEGEGHRSQLADLPNVVLTPHMGASTVDTQREIGDRIVGIVDTFCSREKHATIGGFPMRDRLATSPVA
jgi:D-3-phosphoglycerate dehydrogenase